MSSNHFRKHECNSCGGFHHDNECGKTIRNRCNVLGPFSAIDADCIPKQEPARLAAIIPYASENITLIANPNGTVNQFVKLGFGEQDTSSAPFGNTLNLSAESDIAFTVPRTGYLTDLSATFSSLENETFANRTITVRATVYRASALSNIFTATNATVELDPSFSNSISLGDMAKGTATFAPIPVAVGDRLLLVFSITSTRSAFETSIECKVGAGLTIVQ